jgi:hypothetical protein
MTPSCIASVLLQTSVVALGTTKQPLPGFTGRTAAPKEHGEMGYNYELAAAMPPVSSQMPDLLYFTCSTQQGVGAPIRVQRKAHRTDTLHFPSAVSVLQQHKPAKRLHKWLSGLTVCST